jgi:hypothetical protein
LERPLSFGAKAMYLNVQSAGVETVEGRIVSRTTTTVVIEVKRGRSRKWDKHTFAMAKVLYVDGRVGEIGTVCYRSNAVTHGEFEGQIISCKGGFFRVIKEDGGEVLVNEEYMCDASEERKEAPKEGSLRAPRASTPIGGDWGEE